MRLERIHRESGGWYQRINDKGQTLPPKPPEPEKPPKPPEPQAKQPQPPKPPGNPAKPKKAPVRQQVKPAVRPQTKHDK